jgi:hypothetical protein
VSFDRLVKTILEGKKDEWVLFIKHTLWEGSTGDGPTLQLKPVSYITDKETNIIKSKMKRDDGYIHAYQGFDVMGYEGVIVVFDTKENLEEEIENIKELYNNVKMETVLEPELQPHWGGIVDEL